jgi:hypothetical protein
MTAGGAAATGPAPVVPLARNRGFRLLWIGQVLSDTGTEAAQIAYPLLILALTHSPTIAGLVGTAELVVQLILGLRQHGTSPGVIGLAQAGIGVGGLLGAVIAPRLQGRLPLWPLVILMTALAPLTSGLLVEHFSGQWSMAVFAAALAISAVMCTALPGLTKAGSAGPASCR